MSIFRKVEFFSNGEGEAELVDVEWQNFPDVKFYIQDHSIRFSYDPDRVEILLTHEQPEKIHQHQVHLTFKRKE
jgi:hypothetical protein